MQRMLRSQGLNKGGQAMSQLLVWVDQGGWRNEGGGEACGCIVGEEVAGLS